MLFRSSRYFLVLPTIIFTNLIPTVYAGLNLTNSTIYRSSNLPFDIRPSTPQNEQNYTAPIFPILPFTQSELNPILSPDATSNWSNAYLFNPTAIVLNSTIFLLYRAQNYNKTSSIGLAWSTDGTNFTRYDKPIIYATEIYEKGGGCEDPRIVRVNGTFYVTYTAYDLDKARLCLATSTDLVNWKKYGPIFNDWADVVFSDIDIPSPRLNYTKSGAIIGEKIDGVYHMYWGDSEFYHATSPDMIHWTSLPADQAFARPLNPWENRLIEPGPAPIKTRDNKYILFYNGMTTGRIGYSKDQYSCGQMLIDPSGSFRPYINTSDGVYQPSLMDGPICRIEKPWLTPTTELAQKGQVDKVVFVEGVVQFKGKWWAYFGMGDSYLGTAFSDVQA